MRSRRGVSIKNVYNHPKTKLLQLNLEIYSGIDALSKYFWTSRNSNLARHQMNNIQNYRLKCTLTFGDIYGQIIVWLIVIFLSLASALALWSSARQIFALATVGLILVLSLPFLLFAFVTTLLNNIEVLAVEPGTETQPSATGNQSNQQPIESAG